MGKGRKDQHSPLLLHEELTLPTLKTCCSRVNNHLKRTFGLGTLWWQKSELQKEAHKILGKSDEKRSEDGEGKKEPALPPPIA